MTITVMVTPPSVVPAVTAGATLVVTPNGGTSPALIGSALRVSVANIDDPSTEMAAIADASLPAGTIRIATQDIAGANAYRLYVLDTASNTAQSTPNRIDRTAGGQWVLVGGKGVAGGFTVETTLAVGTDATIGGTLGVTGAAALSSTLSVAGIASVTNATAATNTTTGALVVTGGVGIGGAAFVGGTLGVTGTATIAGHFALGSSAVIDAGFLALLKDTYSGALAVYRGMRVETTHSGAAASASTGIDVVHATAGSNNMDHIVGVQSRPAHNGTGTLAAATGLFAQVNSGVGAGVITDLKLLWGSAGAIAGTAPVNYYGLYIDSISGGSSLNYAIYTNDGAIRLGGATTLASTLAVTGTSDLAGVTCTSLTDSGLTSGRIVLASTTGLLADSAALTFNGSDFVVGAGSGTPGFKINGVAAVTRDFVYQSAGVDRWRLRCDSGPEGGSDTGSDFAFIARHDDGTNAGAAVTLTRAVGGDITIASGRQIKLGNAAVAATPTPTHTLTIKDSTGTVYRIPCVV